MGCNSYQCPANSNYRYGIIDSGTGVCSKDSTSPDLLDNYAEHCGFIRITDAWTLWKYGVTFKELICGNCHNYAPGEYSHGKCNADIEFVFGRNARFNGAYACKEFKKKEGENLAKKTYWTKCGRQFEKSSAAEVTGLKVDEASRECAACPFRMEVTKGWPPVFDHWECRAGSKKPNLKTDWTGSLEDKNTIGVNSLDHQLMEEIRQYCIDHHELNASYNTDHLADCRRTLSISCSSNKKGIAAKRELIEKFFPAKVNSVPEERKPFCNHNECPFHACMSPDCQLNEISENAPHMIMEYGSKASECCQQEIKKKFISDFMIQVKQDSTKPTRACSKCNAGHWYSEENTYVSVVADDGIKTTKRPCEPHTHYCYQFTEGQKKIATDKDFDPDTVPEWCPLEKKIHYTIEEISQELIKEQPEKKKPRIGTESGCNEMREDCPYFCKHNDGCTVLLCRGDALEVMLENFGDVDCDVYRKVAEKVNGTPDTDTDMHDSVNDLAQIDTKTAKIVTFDYSTVDEDTAVFLQEKVEKITLIRLRSKFAIGKELKEAQEKLANNKNGTFGAWASSIGISRQTAYNYINGYEFIVKNFDNIEAAEDLSPSLLFAAAKKDTPKELQKGVVSGDITSLKEFKDLQTQFAEAQKRAADAESNYKTVSESYDRLEKVNTKHYTDAVSAQTQVSLLQQQLEQAKRNSDPSKVQELGNIISDKQQEIETLKKQLKDKPIEVPAVKEKEVIPDAVRLAIYEKVSRLYEGLCKLTETEIQIFAEDVSEDYRDDVIKGTEDASGVLADIANAVWKLTE